jgi:hypothetical protein
MGSPDVSTRQGVCYGIQEVLQSVTRQQLSELLPMVLPMIQTALCDDAESVRTVSEPVKSMKTLSALCLLDLRCPGTIWPERQSQWTVCGPQAAGGAFGILFKGGGGAVDQVIPSLLASLSGDDAQQV